MKSPGGEERLDVAHELSPNSAPPEFFAHPDAFKKGNGAAVAAVGIFPDRNFCKSGGRAGWRLGDKAPGLAIL